jgi:hypothetical protein
MPFGGRKTLSERLSAQFPASGRAGYLIYPAQKGPTYSDVYHQPYLVSVRSAGCYWQSHWYQLYSPYERFSNERFNKEMVWDCCHSAALHAISPTLRR